MLEQHPGIEILVIDDGSPDGTGQLADEMAGDEPASTFFIEPKSSVSVPRTWRGSGGGWPALSAALRDGRRPVAFAEMLPPFMEQTRHADVVIGSRYLHAGHRGRLAMSRLLISYFGCWYARTITGLPVADATGGFNCWRREVLEALDLDRIVSNGYAFQIELKFRAARKGFRLVEVPIVFTNAIPVSPRCRGKSFGRQSGRVDAPDPRPDRPAVTTSRRHPDQRLQIPPASEFRLLESTEF